MNKLLKNHFLYSITILFLSIPFISFSQNEQKIDSLLLVIKTTDDDSIKMVTYSKLRRATYFSKPKVAKDYTFKYLELATKRKDSFHIALAHLYLGNVFITQSDYEKALNNLFKSISYFERKKDSSRICAVYNSIGAVYQHTTNDSLALVYFKKSYTISSSVGNIRRNAIAASNIAHIYNNNKQYEIGIPYLEKALMDLKHTSLIEYYNSIALNLAGAYREAKEYNKALPIYDSVLTKLDTVNDILNYGVVLHGMALLNLEFNKNKKALNQLKKAYELYNKSDYFYQRYDVLPDLIRLHAINGQPKKGLDLFYEYNSIKDSIFNIEKDKNLADALQKYEAEKKDSELKILKKEQELTLVKQHSRNIILSTILGAFSLLLLFLWFRNAKRKKLFKQSLEIKDQEYQITQLKLENEENKSKQSANELNQFMKLIKAKNDQIKELQLKLEDFPEQIKLEAEFKKKINQLHSTTILTDDDWKTFRAIFDQVHPKFIQNLSNHFPSTTSGDLKMGSMLKLNLSNGEISSIFGISPESVRKSKYRLRNKLQFETDEILQNFINNL